MTCALLGDSKKQPNGLFDNRPAFGKPISLAQTETVWNIRPVVATLYVNGFDGFLRLLTM
jgi:hypothetical protein